MILRQEGHHIKDSAGEENGTMLLLRLGHAEAGAADAVGGDVLAQLEWGWHHRRADLSLGWANQPIEPLRELRIQSHLQPFASH